MSGAYGWQPEDPQVWACEHPRDRVLVVEREERGGEVYMLKCLCLDCLGVFWGYHRMDGETLALGRLVNLDGT